MFNKFRRWLDFLLLGLTLKREIKNCSHRRFSQHGGNRNKQVAALHIRIPQPWRTCLRHFSQSVAIPRVTLFSGGALDWQLLNTLPSALTCSPALTRARSLSAALREHEGSLQWTTFNYRCVSAYRMINPPAALKVLMWFGAFYWSQIIFSELLFSCSMASFLAAFRLNALICCSPLALCAAPGSLRFHLFSSRTAAPLWESTFCPLH